MESGQLVLMTLPERESEKRAFNPVPGVILSALGKKKPQHYEVYALNEIWIATENDLDVLGQTGNLQHSVSLN